MNLVMFDIDGTLTQTNSIDTCCFLASLQQSLGICGVDTDWTKYSHATDQGCLEEIIKLHFGRPGTNAELFAAKKRHLSLLEVAAQNDPNLFRSVKGAKEILSALAEYPNTALAIATGAWRNSAKLKLRQAGFTMNRVPFASCDDAKSRENIMMIAEERARCFYSNAFQSRTYIGDALWDVKAAAKMGYHFIGIASGADATRLRAAGARRIVQDFACTGDFMNMLIEIWAAGQNG
jgi:phosphoglycolate phosphatase-like HAD superfamily hydrolase